MNGHAYAWMTAGGLILAASLTGTALAQKSGGILRSLLVDNPPSASIHEEGTVSVVVPYMAVYNNLVMYDQHVAKNSEASIVPDLATSWSWNADNSQLTFKLRQGVKWHDGKPFTARDVKCTFDMAMGNGEMKFRKSPRDLWWNNIESIVPKGDHEVAFNLKRPQPALITLMASGYAPIYSCHVPQTVMRTKPIGTGPFKVAEINPNQNIRLVKNKDYWKPGRPYLDGIEYTIMPSRSTRLLTFIAGEIDMTFPTDVTVPHLKDIRDKAPRAQCTLRPSNVTSNLIINRDAPPFDNPDMRRALALTIDRKAFIDILSEGQNTIGGAMLPPPHGNWGLLPEDLTNLIGYGEVATNRQEARQIMRNLGHGPNKRMKIKVITRDVATFRDLTVIFIDQLKDIYIDAELEPIETSVYYSRVFKKDYVVGINQTGSGVDDPDQHFYENYGCGSLRNYTAYCNPELEKLFAKQSAEADQDKRRKLVWEIDRKLQQDIARPIIAHNKSAGCWQPHVKGLTLMVNSIYNGWRFEDLWLDK
ncbi:MAG: peptide ABC transporter substrate-binding protein [Alphaproteobacteria bacterium]|nr:peptide ABC transporter substrate-binding protein [Alphaproteobacteria bacterium]